MSLVFGADELEGSGAAVVPSACGGVDVGTTFGILFLGAFLDSELASRLEADELLEELEDATFEVEAGASSCSEVVGISGLVGATAH